MRALPPLLLVLLAACASEPQVHPAAPSPARPAPPPVATVVAPVMPPLAPLPEHLGERVDAYASALGGAWGEAFAFSGYLVVARDGVPVFAKGYGKANRTTGAVADGDTRFRIGSITKQFTAVAVLQLAEKGLVRLEDPISKYVPGLPFGDKVTLHHLLSQTSGIFNYTEDEAFMKEHDRPHTHAEMVAVFGGKPLAFEPGAEFSYSNSNYFLLGMVIEKASGQSYEEYLQKNVLGPAGMHRTSTLDGQEQPNTAAGYTVEDDKIVPAHSVDMSNPFAAGAIRSTANDLVRWDRALAGDVLLQRDSKKRMLTPVKGDYAYGFVVKNVAGHEVDWHNGGIDGFTSVMSRVPEERLAVVVLSNSDGFQPEELENATLRMALTGDKIDPPVETPAVAFDAATLGRYPGEYALDPASDAAYRGKLPDAVLASVQAIVVKGDKTSLRFKPNGQGEHGLFLRADHALFTKGAGISLEPEQASGVVKSFTLKQGGLALRYVRTGARPVQGRSR